MSFSLNPTGLSTQTQEEIREELVQKFQATFGPNVNTSTASFCGQIIDIVAEFRALDQQTALAVYSSFDPDGATGTALDARAALTGSIREGATSSVVDGLLEFSGPGTVNNGDLIQNDDNQTQWQAINGPYSDTGGPYPEFVAATFQAVNTGPILANANTNWSLVTAVPNLTAFTNPTDDADVGQDQQSDPDFRVTRQEELYSQGQGPLAAIQGVVSKVDGVTTARVYHNPSVQPADADGIPFKAFNVLVETVPSPPPVSLQQSIFDAIWSATGAGGEAYGTDFTGTVTDSEGNPQPSAFDLVDEVPIYVVVDISTAGTEQPISTNMAQVVADAVLATAQEDFNGIGQNQLGFEYSAIVSNLQAEEQITGATAVTISLSRVALVGPYTDPVEIGIRERPTFDSVNIQVNVT